jgi:tRNA (guanine37-N1)-methyltransferase
LIDFFVLTLFPEFFENFKNTSIIKKGLEKTIFSITVKDIRDNAVNTYGQVDDAPFGGSAGMLLRPEPIFESFDELNIPYNDRKVIFFSPKGRKITDEYILNLTKLKNIVLICGHYEGVDLRVSRSIKEEEVSLGDFVLTGGELPAMILIDSVVRQLEGVIKLRSLADESFSNNLLEHRQWTRPREYRNLSVPDILLLGHHKLIDEYKLEDSIRETLKKRPDLIENGIFEEKIKLLIEKIKREFL